MKRTFVVFEGIDGSGTSTQALLLQSTLTKAGLRVFLTSEPTTGPVGQLIRQIIGKRVFVSDRAHIVDAMLAYLFVADRFDHLHNDVDGIFKKLENGYVVISTRYYLSSYAYNPHSAHDFELVKGINQQFPMADITFYLDCPVEEAMQRIATSGRSPDRNENKDNLIRVQQNYERALREYKGPLFRINALLSAQEQHQQIAEVVLKFLEGGKQQCR